MTDVRYVKGWHDALRGRAMIASYGKTSQYARGYRAAVRELKAARFAVKLNELIEARRQSRRTKQETRQ